MHSCVLHNTDLITQNIELIGGVELTDPIEHATEGTAIHFETTDLDGNPVNSDELFAGHPITMINLWGTWCGPCKAELPELEEISKEYAAKGCQVIGIVTDAEDEKTIQEAKDILAEKGVTYVNLAAFEELMDILPQESWPTSYFVDEHGCLLGEPVIGARPDQYRNRIE